VQVAVYHVAYLAREARMNISRQIVQTDIR
jgi:hypothetical protein